ncbi:P-loop containing nucleoside triphosphate hydrolase protein [Cercophora newfieldiana]|uniref:P-loop containing nucleoside triphosphate hydrolase protein n=1 Tax=Cercophora newfieldiana TaxID=92897 RepID=A0AA39YRL3_9PEZI|nr:P-loop containing nucleoside triphosphate hydrolase protein [Cercophora newfieldiana]
MGSYYGSSGMLYKFANAEQFAIRHEEATRAEHGLEVAAFQQFNMRKIVFKAWVIKKAGFNSFILRADLGSMEGLIPQPGQSFSLVFVDYGNYHDDSDEDSDYSEPESASAHDKDDKNLAKFSCRVNVDPLELNRQWKGTQEFTLSTRQRHLNKLGRLLKPIHKGGPMPLIAVGRSYSDAVDVRLILHSSELTMNSQLDALRSILDGTASEAGQAAFQYLLKFEKPSRFVNLFQEFPHMENPALVKSQHVKAGLRSIFDSLDKDQTAAFHGLRSLPAGICFVPGGPGAGKTRWSLTMAALAQAGDSPVKVLYLLDINRSADDAADRVQATYNKLGQDKVVIRMRLWPMRGRKKKIGKVTEPDNAEDLDEDQEEPLPRKYLKGSDFTTGFLNEYDQMKMNGGKYQLDQNKAPTLDQKAFELWYNNKGSYPLKKPLKFINNEHRDPEERLGALDRLRRTLICLYDDVISSADFIVATPVAASRHLAGYYKPDLLIFDECGHAHELSTLIALAHFEPKAWFFTGDHRQTEPFVTSTAGYGSQLLISTMERAAVNGAIPHQLLINHRARSGLECLASDLFYRQEMRSERRDDSAVPLSTRHLRAWLQGLINNAPKPQAPVTLLGLDIPRLLVSDERNIPAEQVGTSFWNKAHLGFVVQQVTHLLNDPHFTEPPPDDNADPDAAPAPGSIMILSPYKEAVARYRAAVNKIPLGKKVQSRVRILTVDTAQGQEADVVFLDMVKNRASAHVENPKRLCVALTRARQAEVILMPAGMGSNTQNLFRIWNRCMEGWDGVAIQLPM